MIEVGVDVLEFATTNPDVTAENLLASLEQDGDDVVLTQSDRVITFEDASVADFGAESFLIV